MSRNCTADTRHGLFTPSATLVFLVTTPASTPGVVCMYFQVPAAKSKFWLICPDIICAVLRNSPLPRYSAEWGAAYMTTATSSLTLTSKEVRRRFTAESMLIAAWLMSMAGYAHIRRAGNDQCLMPRAKKRRCTVSNMLKMAW